MNLFDQQQIWEGPGKLAAWRLGVSVPAMHLLHITENDEMNRLQVLFHPVNSIGQEW